MREILLATTAIVLLAAPAAAQDAPDSARTDVDGSAKMETPAGTTATTQTENRGLGTSAGGATGAIAGAVVGGPIGALVGGFTGAVIGAETAVPKPAVDYVVRNPVEPVAVEGEIREGYVVPRGAALQPIPDYPDYGYVYADGRPVIVRQDDRHVVYSPGYAVPERTITYVEDNPVDPVGVDTRITTGATVPDAVEIRPVPEDPAYGYIYTDQGPVLVEQNSRTVVWTR